MASCSSCLLLHCFSIPRWVKIENYSDVLSFDNIISQVHVHYKFIMSASTPESNKCHETQSQTVQYAECVKWIFNFVLLKIFFMEYFSVKLAVHNLG